MTSTASQAITVKIDTNDLRAAHDVIKLFLERTRVKAPAPAAPEPQGDEPIETVIERMRTRPLFPDEVNKDKHRILAHVAALTHALNSASDERDKAWRKICELNAELAALKQKGAPSPAADPGVPMVPRSVALEAIARVASAMYRAMSWSPKPIQAEVEGAVEWTWADTGERALTLALAAAEARAKGEPCDARR